MALNFGMVLGDIFGGMGGLTQGLAAGDTHRLAQEKLNLERERVASENAARLAVLNRNNITVTPEIAQMFQTIGMPDMTGKTLDARMMPFIDASLKAYEQRQTEARDVANRRALADVYLRGSTATTPATPGTPAVPPEPGGDMYGGDLTPGRPALPPAPGRAAVPQDQLIASLLAMRGGPEFVKSMGLQPGQNRFSLVSAPEGGPTYMLNTATGQREVVFDPSTRAPVAPPPVGPGQKLSTHYDVRGRPSFDVTPEQATNREDRLAQGLGFGSFESAPEPVKNAINQQTKNERVEIAGAMAGARTQQEFLTKQNEILGLDRNKYRHPVTGEAPPANMTRGEAVASGFMETTEKQRESLAGISNARNIVNTLGGMADRLITSDSWIGAKAQGAWLQGGATTGANPVASAYAAEKDAFLGNLSKSVAAERGVLTDQDIRRMSRGLPTFYDTKQVKDLKMAIMNQIIDHSEAEANRAIFGGAPSQAYRTRLNKLLDQLSGIPAAPEAPAAGGAPAPTAPTTPTTKPRSGGNLNLDSQGNIIP